MDLSNIPIPNDILIGVVGTWVVSAILSAIPKPKEDSKPAYVMLYNTLQWAGANFPLIVKTVTAKKK